MKRGTKLNVELDVDRSDGKPADKNFFYFYKDEKIV